MLIQNQTNFTSEGIVKRTNVDIPLTIYVRGSGADNDVVGGSVDVQVKGEDGEFHSYPEGIFNAHGVSRLYVHWLAEYRVVISAMTNPVDVEII